MGATTTQGTGNGVAKKTPYASLAVSKHLGPRTMSAGRVVCENGQGMVRLPRLPGIPEMYVVLLTPTGPSPTYILKNLQTDDDANWSFCVASGERDIVNWSVVKIGF